MNGPTRACSAFMQLRGLFLDLREFFGVTGINIETGPSGPPICSWLWNPIPPFAGVEAMFAGRGECLLDGDRAVGGLLGMVTFGRMVTVWGWSAAEGDLR
jgi:hypothetical protein